MLQNGKALRLALREWLPGTIVASADEVPLPAERGARVVRAAQERVELELRDITVGALWQDSELSRTEFSRAFRRVAGQPPRAYVQARRVERAKHLLASARSLSDIALTLGFYDQSHFTRVFKHYTGETPAAFRRRTNVQDRPESPPAAFRRRTNVQDRPESP